MGIYLGNTKITGTGVQVDSTLSQTSQHPATNAAITEALTGLGYSAWQKPTDWIDIRSGALPNSVYYLVGHSADYQTYPTFDIYAQVSNSSTYDIYIDGVKKYSAVASGTNTTLTWSTLALTTGYDTTYPSALRTHIVRITPTDSTKTLTWVGNNTATGTTRAGLLWAHFNINNSVQIRYLGNGATILEAVTCAKEELTVSNMYSAFYNTPSLKEVPTLDGNNGAISLYQTFSATSITKLKLKNLTSNIGPYAFSNATALKKIICENAYLMIANNIFNNCEALENLPCFDLSSTTTAASMLKGCTSLKNTFLDMQAATGLTRVDVSGTSTARIDGLKGLLVSSSAPFSGTSPQINASYTGLDRAALVNLFNSLPTVDNSQVCNITGTTGSDNLTIEDLAIATSKGWTITR